MFHKTLMTKEAGSAEWITSPESAGELSSYVEGDKYGIYKKAGVEIPRHLRKMYNREKWFRDIRIYEEYHHKLYPTAPFRRKWKKCKIQRKLEKLSLSDKMEMKKLLEKG